MRKERYCIGIIVLMLSGCMGVLLIPERPIVYPIEDIEEYSVEVLDNMTIYGYKKERDVQNDKYPQNNHLCVETDYGIYFVDASNNNNLLKTTDEGVTVETVDTLLNSIRAFWYARDEDKLYFASSGSFSVIDLTDDSITEIDALVSTEIKGPFDIVKVGTSYWLMGLITTAGDDYTRIREYNDSYVFQANHDGPTAYSGTYLMTYGVVVGTDIYFISGDGAINPHIFKFATSTTTYTDLEDTGAVAISEGDLAGITYDESNILSFVLYDNPVYYYYTYAISTDTLTKNAEYNVSLMLNRNTNTSNDPPFNLEKGFHITSLYIYQISRTGGNLLKIADLTNAGINTGTIVAITDTYLFIKKTDGNIELWKFQTMAEAITECLVYHEERDYPTADLTYNSNVLHLEDGMFVQVIGLTSNSVDGLANTDIIFEGYILKPEDETDEDLYMKEVELVNPAYYDLMEEVDQGTLFTGDTDAWLDILDGQFTYITKGVYADGAALYDNFPFNSEKGRIVLLNQLAILDSFTWRTRPKGVLDYNDGTIDSTINYDQDTPVWDVNVSKKNVKFNKITVRGAYAGGTQIISTDADSANDYPDQQERGIVPLSITVSWVFTTALADAFAAALLGVFSATYTEIEFSVRGLTNGFIPPGEQITFAYSYKNISSDQWFITRSEWNDLSKIATYTITNSLKWEQSDLTEKEAELSDQISEVNERTNVKTGWDLGTSYTDCTLSFSTLTFTLTLVAASMSYWIDGRKYTFTENQTVDITDTEGLWYIYFDGAVLTASQTPWVIKDGDKAMVAYLYYDADGNTELGIFWEFHSYQMSPADHDREHNTTGCKFQEGFVLSEASELITLTEGSGYDEDILISVTDGAGSGLFEQELSPGQFPVWYRSGATAWRFHAATTLPVYDNAGGDNVHYNSYSAPNWASTASQGANRYVAYWICLINGIAGHTVISLMGQTEPAILATAQDLSYNDLDLTGLPFNEITQLWKVIYKTDSTFVEAKDLRGTNTPGGVYTPPESEVSDEAYSATWDLVTTIAPSKNAVYDKIEAHVATLVHTHAELAPTTIVPTHLTTSGVDKVYWSYGATYFGTTSKTNNAYLNITFPPLPANYDEGEDVVFHFLWLPMGDVGASTEETIDYKMPQYRNRDGAGGVLIATPDSTFTGSDNYYNNIDTITITGTTLLKQDVLNLLLYVEDDDNAFNIRFGGCKLVVPIE